MADPIDPTPEPFYEDATPDLDAEFEQALLRELGFHDNPSYKEHQSGEQDGREFYTTYKIKVFYCLDTGLVMGKPAGLPGAGASIMRIHAPVGKKFVYWRAERLGQKPVLPHPDAGNANEVLQKAIVSPGEPVLQPGGNVVHYSAEGWYVYLQYKPLADGDTHAVPATPLMDLTAEDLNAKGFEFSRDILKSKPPAAFIQNDLSTAQLNISSVP
jgi:hypothetical protein